MARLSWGLPGGGETYTLPSLLAPTMHLSFDTGECLSHMVVVEPGSLQPSLCHPGHTTPSQSSDADLMKHPHAYLIWDLSDKQNCASIYPTCLDPSNPGDLEEGGFPITEWGYRLYDLTQSQTVPIRTYGGGERRYIVPGPCGEHRAYEIRTYARLQKYNLYIEAPGAKNTVQVGVLYPCTDGYDDVHPGAAPANLNANCYAHADPYAHRHADAAPASAGQFDHRRRGEDSVWRVHCRALAGGE